MLSVKVTGIKNLQKKLKKNARLDDVKTVVKKHGAQMQEGMVRKAEFTKGYQTGTTRRSIRGEIIDGGFAYEAGPSTEYAPYLEYGTRFMDSQPFVEPALEEQAPKFKKDLEKLVK